MVRTGALSRRAFIHGAAAGGIVLALSAPPDEAAVPTGQAVGIGVIGTGAQGRALLDALSRLPGAAVKAVCDTSPTALARGGNRAPGAVTTEEYRRLLDMPGIEAVFVATPSHRHRQIVLDALQAGKHVYCEAPLASTLEDARAIAAAAKGAAPLFQAGLQLRCHPQQRYVNRFLRSGVLGDVLQARGQWHRKESWRRVPRAPEGERETNWRLYHASSAGLLGEAAIHHLDVASWGLRALPLSAQGFGGILHWKDGREVPDSVQCVLEYPDGVRLFYDATLASSYGGSHQIFTGSDATILAYEDRAWMIKEADAPALGWEVYARKEQRGDQPAVVLDAYASPDPRQFPGGVVFPPPDTNPRETATAAGYDPLYWAAATFLACIRDKTQPPCGAREGLQATVTAIKANEAILSGTRVTFRREWFEA